MSLSWVFLEDTHDFWKTDQSAKRDTQVSYGFEFGSYLLICTTVKVAAQVPHLDIMMPNYQLTLMVTDNSPGTIVYTSNNTTPVHNVPTFMKWLGEPTDFNIAVHLNENDELCSMLKNYGVVFDALEEENLAPVFHETLSRGTTISIPGSVVHVGPSSNKFRAMLLFTAHPKEKDDTYSSENQYFHGTILIDIVSALLSRIGPENKTIQGPSFAC
jgi:hypothetical protein